MILGVGVDIVKISRMDHVLERWKDRFMNRIFTSQEIKFCTGKKFPSQHFAIRFAAKEAFLKALGLGMMAGIPWKDIEIINDSTGKPKVKLHSKARETYQKNNGKSIFLSLSHDGEYGIAQVILEGDFEGSYR
ncbi:MAG: holo-ACP synthase [Thermodesulfobacteriota bacterium]|nr:holo-ACP synthase [Thermodesulfobacteriota bacterium]